MFALVVQFSIADHPIQMTFSSHIYIKNNNDKGAHEVLYANKG